jgi:hypothetical protein
VASIVSGLASLVGGNIASGIADVVKLFKVDPNLALQEQEKLAEIQFNLQGKILDSVTAQAQVNLAEAQSKNIFVAGWRPFVGWVCGSAFAYAFIIQPLLTFIFVATKSTFNPATLPKLDISQMMPVLLGMLGLAAARTVEKVNGISDGH